MRLSLILLPLALAACIPVGGGGTPPVAVPPGQVRVVQAQATPSTLALRMSNGERCIATRPEGVQGSWSGTTGDCGFALPFTVTYRQGGDPARFRVEAPSGAALGPGGVPGPRAEVFVVDVDGVRRLFSAPLGRNVRFEPIAS